MKKNKFLALGIAAVMMMSMALTANAASITINSTANTGTVETDTTQYTYYQILEADIEDATKITVDDKTGASTAATSGENVPKVSYFVSTQAKATALERTGLFTVTKDVTKDKWYVALTDKNTTAAAIATALDGIKGSFDVTGTFAQTQPGGTATKDGLNPGYYLITSTLGDVLAVQTLADVTINTKNSYPGVNKTIANTDKSAQIGDTITYTITVTVPESAADQIVVTDTMTEGLTFKAFTSVKNSDNEDVTYTPADADANHQTFTVTFAKADVENNKGKTITIIYTATLNEKAVVDAADNTDEDENSNDNTVKLNYGNHFESKTVVVETDTQKFTFDKVDGSESTTKLPGAVFELRKDGAALSLIEVAAGETYRIAMPGEQGAVTQMTTTGKVITVNGVDGDVTYQLVETKAPTGYNLPENPSTDVTPATDNSLELTIQNNKGTVLPSTGGMGTTLFYIFGAALVLGGAVLLVTRRRMED